MLITALFFFFRSDGHRGPRNEVRSLSLAERLVGYELETFQFVHSVLIHLAPRVVW